MKKTFAAIAATLALLISTQAKAHVDDPLSDYSSSISASGGNSAYLVTGNSNGPWTCFNYGQTQGGCAYVTYGGCYGYDDYVGLNISGESCCHNPNYFCATGADKSQVSTTVKTASTDLAAVFSTDDQRSYYWGYVNASNRSPESGRGNSATAKLDACIGHGETDMLGTGSTGWSTCYNKCDSSTNGYCNNSGTNNGSSANNAACKDRCDCVITGYGTCEGQ